MPVQLHIRTASRHYLQALPDGALSGGAPWPREWETFTLAPIVGAGGTIRNGDKVRLRTFHGTTVRVGADKRVSAAPPAAKPVREPVGAIAAGYDPAPAGKRPGDIELPGPGQRLPGEIRLPVVEDIFTVVLPPGTGDVLRHFGPFGLKTARGMYLCAEEGGGGPLVANRTAMGPWETFSAELHPEPETMVLKDVPLRAPDGQQWLYAINGGGGELGVEAAPKQTRFDILAADAAAAGFHHGARVHLRTTSQHYLFAAGGGGGPVTAAGVWPREWETFTLVLAKGAANLDREGSFGLRTADGSFVGVTGGQMHARARALDASSTFALTQKSGEAPSTPTGDSVKVELHAKPSPRNRTADPPDGQPPRTESASGDYVYATRRVTLTASSQDALLLDPVIDLVWPGAVIDGARWENGEYREITETRRPLDLLLSMESTDGVPMSMHVASPSAKTVSDALQAKRPALVGTPLQARITHEVEEIHSSEQLRAALDGAFDNGVYKLASKFEFANRNAVNRVLLKYYQIYYTISAVTPPNDKGPWLDVFASGRQPGPDEMLIRSVSYGRMLLFTFESSEQMSKLLAAASFAYSGVKLDASVNYEEVLNRTRINLLVLGGAAGVAQEVAINYKDIPAWIRAGERYTDLTQAVPLAYRMHFLKDNAVANVCLTTTYTERHAIKTTGRVRVTNMQIVCVEEDDPGTQIELYGTLKVRGLVEGGGQVPSSLGTEVVWHRDDDHYVDMSVGTTVRVGAEPVFTFRDLPAIQDKAYIEVEGRFMEYDDFGDNDPVTGDVQRVYINKVQPIQVGKPAFTSEFYGDGNIVHVKFDVELL